MTNDATAESGALVWIEVVAAKLATGHPADGMDEVGPVKVFKPILVRIVGVGPTVEIVSRRIFAALLITCIL